MLARSLKAVPAWPFTVEGLFQQQGEHRRVFHKTYSESGNAEPSRIPKWRGGEDLSWVVQQGLWAVLPAQFLSVKGSEVCNALPWLSDIPLHPAHIHFVCFVLFLLTITYLQKMHIRLFWAVFMLLPVVYQFFITIVFHYVSQYMNSFCWVFVLISSLGYYV